MSQHEEAIKIIENIITITTPRTSFRGKQDRNKLVKEAMQRVKAMTYDKRMKKQ